MLKLALLQAQNCHLDVTQRSVDMRAAFSRLAHASQVLHDPGVERAEFLFVEVAEIGWGDELRHEISPCAWAATIAEPSFADREQRVRQAALARNEVEKPTGLRQKDEPMRGCS